MFDIVFNCVAIFDVNTFYDTVILAKTHHIWLAINLTQWSNHTIIPVQDLNFAAP